MSEAELTVREQGQPAVERLDLGEAYRSSQVGEVLEQLDRELVGLLPVKTRIREIAHLLLIKLRRQGNCTGVGPCSLTMLGNYEVSAYFQQPGSGLQFVPITPCRLLDTRSGSPIPGGTYQTFDLPALAQNNGCADLSSALAYSLNVTLVPQNHPVSYLTIWPAGLAQPVTSTMNSLDGRVKANAAIVPAGVSAGVNVDFTNTTNLLLDIDGYFTAPSSSTLKFYPLTPCRVADTRSSNYPPGLGTPNLSGGAARNFPC